jgi:hypothetical protein
VLSGNACDPESGSVARATERIQPAASLIAVSKLFASKAGML